MAGRGSGGGASLSMETLLGLPCWGTWIGRKGSGDGHLFP